MHFKLVNLFSVTYSNDDIRVRRFLQLHTKQLKKRFPVAKQICELLIPSTCEKNTNDVESNEFQCAHTTSKKMTMHRPRISLPGGHAKKA